MRHFLRGAIILVAAIHLVGCRHWQPQLEGPREALEDPDASHVRLTLTDMERVEVRVAEIRGDSIYGTLGGSGPLSCVEASPDCDVRLPMSEVGFVEVRSFSGVRTAAIVLVPVGAVVIALVSSGDCQRGPFGNC